MEENDNGPVCGVIMKLSDLLSLLIPIGKGGGLSAAAAEAEAGTAAALPSPDAAMMDFFFRKKSQGANLTRSRPTHYGSLQLGL